jgi:predicted molibdopterin-dependent oxidoreductase YjgC
VARAGGWLLPLASHFEYAGSFTNFTGRVQRFEPALALPDAALPAYEYGIELAHTLGTSLWPSERPDNVLEAIWQQIAAAHPDIPHVSWADVPAFGLYPRWARTAHPRSVMDAPDPMRSGFAGAVEVQDG